jgi:hypothetical protein
MPHIAQVKQISIPAIRLRYDIQMLVLMKDFNQSKLEVYYEYLLASQLGLNYAIPEDFDVATSAITNICFLGVFPKKINIT